MRFFSNTYRIWVKTGRCADKQGLLASSNSPETLPSGGFYIAKFAPREEMHELIGAP